MANCMKPRLTPRVVHPMLLAWGAVGLVAALFCAGRPLLQARSSTFADARGAVKALQLVQESSPDENEIAPEQVEKYIAVYKAMQHNHSLTIEQAAPAQGLTVDAFRDIEHRIERDDMIREHVRQALRADNAEPTPSAPSGLPSPEPAR
jgi:hypothetical protein